MCHNRLRKKITFLLDTVNTALGTAVGTSVIGAIWDAAANRHRRLLVSGLRHRVTTLF